MLRSACHRCQHPVRPAVHFCTHCGARLSAPVSADAITLQFRRR